MAQTIYEVLDDLRASATSEADKGTKLERLFKAYLMTDPVYADQFSQVWMWNDWPGRGGKHDTGIDLVAAETLTGGLVAIQCKFFAPTSTIGKPDIDSFLSASGKEGFAQRIIVSTTDKWNGHAEDAIKFQQIPVRRIGMSELEASSVDWSRFSLDAPEKMTTGDRQPIRPHQTTAIDACRAGFDTRDRGKLIMACGTGKTFAALRLAEQMVGAGGSVLFLVPSISLLSQSLREWSTRAETPLRPLAVCSDRKSTVRSTNTDEDISTVDLALPATTNVAILESRLTQAMGETWAMTVVFATYQSIDVVARAQTGGELKPFDLIICDEAHRTTGTTLAGEDESAFVRVHREDYIRADKRLYMTATPRIYEDSSKAKAGQANAVLASMDDETLYGPEFHRLGFGEAVSRDLLTDYKVLVLAVDETAVAKTFQMQLSEDGELKLDDAAKIIGCWNGLAKRGHAEHSFASDPTPMRRAVAFSGTIKASKKIESLFAGIVDHYTATQSVGDDENILQCDVRHVDGTYNALERNARLDWLKGEIPDGHCRILTNARCLSEGVDVPALDAVMFLSPRKSVVDIVQSVGRVMRKAPGKNYGYIILPVGIPANLTAEQALRDNKKYAAVWEVLQALRAHDERFDAMINRIDLTSARDDKINIIGVGVGEPGDSSASGLQQSLALNLTDLDEWRDAVYAKIVSKVGSRRYWEDWARDVADIAQRHITRITALLDDENLGVAEEFAAFLEGLRGNLNDSISRADAVEMLAQHLITRPIFDALFAGYDFAAHNPVAQTMERMLAALDEHSLDSENETLEKFYESVRMRVRGIDNAEGRQRIIIELYDTFFATAFRRTVDKLGIVYTPVEIVDFILHSADWALRESFGQGLTDEGVHILDGFTGTGTFIVRLLQSGLITPHDLARKYAHEIHANEILLLAYYIAAVNIETTYQDLRTDHLDAVGYEPFPGLILTDTFQSWEDDDRLDLEVFPENNERLELLKGLPITVIVGNPPYSVGQGSANDDNANESYPSLDSAIESTYVARSTATSRRTLYDSYIRAIKWASLRIEDRGVIAFVTNGGFLDSNSADGMRKSLACEFSAIHVFNLRGNQRTAGEESRREGGKVFGGGSRATVAITVLVKNPAKTGDATIRYADVGDYLSRENKLAILAAAAHVGGMEALRIAPNKHGDWLNQRQDEFLAFTPLGTKQVGAEAIFGAYCKGLNTARSLWAYASSENQLRDRLKVLIATYESDRRRIAAKPDTPLTLTESRIKWSRSLEHSARRNVAITFDSGRIRESTFRPFQAQKVYFDRLLNDQTYSLFRFFPTPELGNVGIVVTDVSSHAPFSFLMVGRLPDMHTLDTGQYFPRWRYEAAQEEGVLGFCDSDGEVIRGYRRVDNITDAALNKFRCQYVPKITKDDIFDYVYGLMHSPEYRTAYSADVKKTLPRIPLVNDPWPFIEAGRALAELHLGYEAVKPYPLGGLQVEPTGDPFAFYQVEKMAFTKVRVDGKLVSDMSSIRYNARILLTGIPQEGYRYMLGARSAIEWIIERFQIRTDAGSGIVNDPNDWSREVGNPRYILDLFARIVTVSLETMKIVDSLPELKIRN